MDMKQPGPKMGTGHPPQGNSAKFTQLDTTTPKADPTPQPKVATAAALGTPLGGLVIALLEHQGLTLDEGMKLSVIAVCIFLVGYMTPQRGA